MATSKEAVETRSSGTGQSAGFTLFHLGGFDFNFGLSGVLQIEPRACAAGQALTTQPQPSPRLFQAEV